MYEYANPKWYKSCHPSAGRLMKILFIDFTRVEIFSLPLSRIYARHPPTFGGMRLTLFDTHFFITLNAKPSAQRFPTRHVHTFRLCLLFSHPFVYKVIILLQHSLTTQKRSLQCTQMLIVSLFLHRPMFRSFL